MAQKCEICGKGPLTGKKVSHSHVRTPKRWSANIQKIRVIIEGKPKTVKVCTKCLKAGKVVRAG